jgi:zinc resistance-associated protein
VIRITAKAVDVDGRRFWNVEDNSMWKTLLAGTAALTIVAAGTVALAQPMMGHRQESFRRGPPSAQDLQAYADARLAALKAGLTLTEQQAVHWPAFEQAARAVQKLRIDRMTAQAQQRNNPPAQPDPAERIRQRGNAMADMGLALEKLGAALDPLYKSLDENQKRRFAALSRLGGPRGGFAMGRRDGDRGGFRGRDDFRGERRDFRDGPRGPRGRGGAPDEYPR